MRFSANLHGHFLQTQLPALNKHARRAKFITSHTKRKPHTPIRRQIQCFYKLNKFLNYSFNKFHIYSDIANTLFMNTSTIINLLLEIKRKQSGSRWTDESWQKCLPESDCVTNFVYIERWSKRNDICTNRFEMYNNRILL